MMTDVRCKREITGKHPIGMNCFLASVFMLLMLILSGCSVETFRALDGDGFYTQNEKAYQLITDGKYDEAHQILEGILKKSQDDTALSNMAWLLYCQGRYDEALDYNLKALAIKPNSEEEYINQGNILLETSDDYNEAIAAYDKALAMNSKSSKAIYGKGIGYSCQGDYQNAAANFNQYILLMPEDPDGHEQLVYSLIDQNRIEEASVQADWFLNHAGNEELGYILKASCAYFLNDIHQLGINVGNFIIGNDEDPRDLSKWYILRNYVTSEGDYAYAVELDKRYIKCYPEAYECYLDLADAAMWLKRYQDAEEACKNAIAIQPDSPESYNILGDIYAHQTQYDNAIIQYTLAYGKDEGYTLARSNLFWAMYQSGAYEEIVKLGLRYEKEKIADYDVYWYLASSYEDLFQFDDAISYYEKALEQGGGNSSNTCYRIARLHMINQDLAKAREYTKRALSLDPQNSDALWLSEELFLAESPLGVQVAKFIERNYLYEDYVADYDNKMAGVKKATNLEQLEQALKTFLLEDDYFSYLVKGEEYQSYEEMLETPTVHYEIKYSLSGKPLHYVKIDAFYPKTGLEFKKAVGSIAVKDNAVLVIDLRGNGGGDMKACSAILDYLLGDCVTVNFLDRDGYTNAYYSSADQVKFKQILILQDENTASASELLILGVLRYNLNVTLIGGQTFGKGVSQLVFDSPQHGFAFFLVNTHWNVREANIHYYGIMPDVKAKTEAECQRAIESALTQ